MSRDDPMKPQAPMMTPEMLGMKYERRYDRTPALGGVADCLCTLDKTDGFCSPKQRNVCRCWDIAERLLHDSGFSSRALCWILSHRTLIENEASKP